MLSSELFLVSTKLLFCPCRVHDGLHIAQYGACRLVVTLYVGACCLLLLSKGQVFLECSESAAHLAKTSSV